MAINPLGKTLSFTYDSLKHLSAVNLQGIYNRSYTYKALSGSRSSNLVSKVDYTQNGNSNFSRLYFDYTYDAAGNITHRDKGTVLLSPFS